MPSDKCDSTMARVMGLIFCCSTSFQPERCILPYRCVCNTYNEFFMDLPIPSFVSHSSLLTTKSVADTWWLPFIAQIIRNFHSGYFACRNSFQRVVDSYCCIVWDGNEISWNFYWFMPTFTGESLKYTEKQRIYGWFLISITGAYDILLIRSRADFRNLGDKLDKSTILFLVVVEYL